MSNFADRLPPSLRGLVRHKRFAAMAITSLGVAIALNTTMYSVTDALLFPRIAMRHPEHLYHMPFYGDYKGRLTPDVKLEAIRGLSFFEDIALALPGYGASNQVERGSILRTASVLMVSSNYFTMLGVSPLAGRLLTEADVNSPASPVVVSERFWKQVFPDRTALDTATFLLDGRPKTVVGILAYESDFPGSRTDIWQLPPDNASRWQQSVFVFNVVRLKEGLTLSQAFAELTAASDRLGTMAGDGPKNARFDLEKMIEGPLRVGNLHLGVIYAVLSVLFVACFNLANLQLARGLSRARELATRAAVGATRRDLVRLLVVESAWLAGAGLVLGVILTFWGIHLVRTAIPASLGDYVFRPQVSWRLFAFATITGTLALAIVGLLPAIRVSRVDVNEIIKSGAGTGTTRKSRWQAGALVVCQVGLALMLVVGATFLIRQAATLHALDINPALERIAFGIVRITPSGASDHRTLRDASNVLLERANAILGVAAAATLHSEQPLHRTISLAQPGQLAGEVPTGMYAYNIVSAGFLKVYGTRIIEGRDFREGETAHSVIVDARTARFLWPGASPIGRQIKMGSDERHDGIWLDVVGVAAYVNLWGSFNVNNQEERTAASLGAIWVLNSVDDTTRLYRGLTGQGELRPSGVQVYVRGSDKVERLPLQLRRGLGDEAAGFRVGYASQLYSALALDAAKARQDFLAGLFTSFALIALALSSLGVYAVVSHTVSQRTREIGVRVALGASEGDIRQSVMVHGNIMALSGIAVGLLIRAYASDELSWRPLSGDVSDTVLFAISATLLFTTTLLASYIPARRAMRINPVEALRND